MKPVDPMIFAGLTEDDKLAAKLGLGSTDAYDILAAVCLVMDLTKEEVMSPKRTNRHVWARSIAYNYLRRAKRLKLMEIGAMFNRNHASVVNGIKQFDSLVKFDKEFKSAVKEVKELLR